MHNANLSKRMFILLRLWAAASLLLACLILFSTLLEQDEIFQPYDFNSPSHVEIHQVNILRSLGNLLLAIIFAIITFSTRHNKTNQFNLANLIILLLFTIAGMLLGLVFFYVSFCCLSPPTYYLGFPFAWLHGEATGNTIAVLKSKAGYLKGYFFHTPWHIYTWAFIANLNFWFIAGTLLVRLRRKT